MAQAAAPPHNVLIRVPHVQQQYSWDCGLACTKMVLKFLKVNIDDFRLVCSQLGFGTSVWTIDLAHIMAHYKIPHHYMTITLGVDKGYSNKSYYMSNFTRDEHRVTDLFSCPQSLGIYVNKRTVSIDDLRHHLSTGNIAVFLIDWSRLDCLRCDRKVTAGCFSGAMKCLFPYQGHYIVVVGYDNAEQIIYYKNPSYTQELCCCSVKRFDTARKSYGTDEDAIFIYKDGIPSDLSSNSEQDSLSHD